MEKEVMGLKQTKHINEDKHKSIIELFPKYDLSQIFFEYSYLSSETLVELILDLKERHQLPKKPSYCLQILFKTGTFIDTVARRWPRWLGGCLIVKVVETIEYPFKSRSQQEARAIKESMECCICWERAPVEEMCFCDPLALTTVCQSSSAVQIEQQSEVHCFCKQCLIRHAEASADEMPLADSGLGLRCMTNDCENPITFFELKAFIPDELAKKLEERSAELSIAHAKLNNMERCRKCNCAVELGKTTAQMQVFTCPECKAQFCRLCDEPWIKEHEGISCEEFLRQNSHARLLEKRLSDVVVRKCPKCKLAFIKQEGCNHITCKCGHTQCYICRVDNINHDHFCSCSGLVKRNSDGTYKCPTCSKTCQLFENPSLQEQRQMETIRKKAREEETKKAAAEKKKKKFVPVTVAGSSSLAMKASNKVNAKGNGLTSISAKSATMTNGNGKGVAAPKKTSLFGGWL